VLASINLLNYLDRNVIFAIFEPLKRDLSLTDAQLGWLGAAYILVFSIAALPFGVISDIKSRKAVIAWGTACFSAFTAMGGLVRTFNQLFFTRARVGVGEAAYGPASASLVADHFPGKNRAFAMAILAAGVPVGGVLGILAGGWLEGIYGWRVALMAVGIPGFLFAVFAAGLADPNRPAVPLTFRSVLHTLEIGIRGVVRHLYPALGMTVVGLLLAWLLAIRYGTSSRADTAVLAVAIGLGAIWTVWRWVRLVRTNRREETPFTPELEDAVEGLVQAGLLVLRTPTLVFVFVAGAMISFGMNGIVGWGPTFMTREYRLTAAEAANLLGKWGLVAGVLGALAGGVLADWLRRYTERSRVITTAAGFLIGGPIAIWILTVRDLDVFVPGFVFALFCFSWYNGPMNAVIFDVVPARVSSTVVGAYLLFIHLAGDAIALPLVGALSDNFGLDRAVLVLPIVALAGGIVMLGALRTVGRDMRRVASATGEHAVIRET
jgi:MFS family permease